MSKIPVYFRQNLVFLREKNGYEIEEFCDLADMPIKNAEQYERGLEEPDIQDLIRICQVFNISIDDMLTVNLKQKDRLTEKKK